MTHMCTAPAAAVLRHDREWHLEGADLRR
jgi:hypothetical protein